MLVYKIINNITNKIYIGLTTRTVEERIREHLKDSKIHKYPLYHAINKYGWNNFKVEVIDTAETIQELNSKEEYWIKQLNCISPNGYNLQTGGLSKRQSKETKAKIRSANIGRILTEEHKEKISLAHRGKKHSKEHVAKIVLANTGKKRSQEFKNRLSIVNIGKHPSKEARLNMSLAHKGQIAWNKGKCTPKETKEKIRLAHVGTKQSKETKLKISKALKALKDKK